MTFLHSINQTGITNSLVVTFTEVANDAQAVAIIDSNYCFLAILCYLIIVGLTPQEHLISDNWTNILIPGHIMRFLSGEQIEEYSTKSNIITATSGGMSILEMMEYINALNH